MEQKEQLLEEKEKELDCERKWHEDYAKKLDTIAHKLLQQDGTRPGRLAWTMAKQSSVAWNKARESPVAWKKAKTKRLGRMLLPEGKKYFTSSDPHHDRNANSLLTALLSEAFVTRLLRN